MKLQLDRPHVLALAGEFPDLLRWRDDTYVAFRRPRTPGNPSVRAA